MKQLRSKSKIWIEMDGEPVLGPGRVALLEAIDHYGSISQASSRVGISYRRAWSYIHAMEERLGIKVVKSQKGGRGGGGTTLTDDARKMLRRYQKVQRGINKVVDQRFRDVFR